MPFRFQPSVAGLTVATELREEQGDGSFGIGCDASEPGDPGRGYLFILQPFLRGASIWRMDATGYEWVAFRHVASDPADRHQLRATCSGASGGTVLRLDVDGRRVLDVVDRAGIDSFGSAVTVVLAGGAAADVRFEHLRAEKAGPLSRSVKPATKPLAYRYAIEMTDDAGEPATTVSLGDHLLVIVSSRDLPRDRRVPFQLCVDQVAKQACTREQLDGGSSYVVGWNVDPGEGRNGRFRLSVRIQGKEVAAVSAALAG